MKLKSYLWAILLLCLSINSMPAQTQVQTFEKIELLVPNGNKVSEKSVRVHFLEDKMLIESTAKGGISKTFNYSEIRDAEYSYSKNPRWKTGLGMGAASIVFPPLLLIAIPLGFTKHRRHWLTIRTENDYAVLKLSKQNRKLLLPAFETKTGVDVKSGWGK